jgi:predicted ArsR family transcriptional regulator
MRGPTGDVPDTARHRALSAVSRVRMLDLLRRGDGLTAAEVAEATGLHPSTVRAHLEQLAASGLATRERTGDGTPGRPAWRYRAAAPAAAPVPSPYRELAAALIGYLAHDEDDPHASGIRAGRAWGRSLAASLSSARRPDQEGPVDGMVRVLDRLGFTPRVVDRPGPASAEIHLRSCPFLDLAVTNPDVVCGVHQGVIGGALNALGAPAAQADLEPFAMPGACVVKVRAAQRRTTSNARPRTRPDGERR